MQYLVVDPLTWLTYLDELEGRMPPTYLEEVNVHLQAMYTDR